MTSSLSDIQRNGLSPDELAFPAERRLEGRALEQYLDRHGSAYVVRRDPEGRPHARRSFYIRKGSVFWLPESVASTPPGAQPWIAIAFIDESRHGFGFGFVVIQGDARIVAEGEWEGWLRVDADQVASHVSEGFAA
jgi:hypothetical protein